MSPSRVSVCRRNASALLPLAMLLLPAEEQGQPRRSVPGPLRVSANGRHFIEPDGRPFFWLGDTAWLLLQRTRREDVELYFRTRAAQGFTVIQAALVNGEEQVVGTLGPNAYGDQAFLAGNPASPLVSPGNDIRRAEEYDYWDHVDYVVEQAAAHGLALGLAPLFVGQQGAGYRYLTVDAAFAYGVFLGRRYGHQPHLFWILGGDNTPDSETRKSVWREMARGITIAVAGVEDYERTLMTYHIDGQKSSSEWFHEDPWLDFNMIQVWGDEPTIFPKVGIDYRLTPAKPTVLGEGSYEDSPQYPSGPVGAFNVRRQAYWSYFAGGHYTYGNTNTWNFGTYPRSVTGDWMVALDSTGARHMSALVTILASLEWWTLVPDLSIFTSGTGSGAVQNAALRSSAGDTVLVYLSSPMAVTLRLDGIPADAALATWIDPQSGVRTVIGRMPTTGTVLFTPRAEWQDALLLLEAEDDSPRTGKHR